MINLFVKAGLKALALMERGASMCMSFFLPHGWALLEPEQFPLFKEASQKISEEPKPEVAKYAVLIIPFRDQWSVTEKCLKSLEKQQVNLPTKVVLADNGSTESSTAKGIASYVKKSSPSSQLCFFHERLDFDFNFSKINNICAEKHAGNSGGILGFINNDIEFTEPNQLDQLITFANKPSVGALGCTLVYEDRKIQHLFVAPGVKIIAAHPLKGQPLNLNLDWFKDPRPVPAVTGAALFVKSDAFLKVSGFNEDLPTLGQDVDLCLKLQKAGFSNWTLPNIVLIHKESVSKGRAIAKTEVEKMYELWGDYLINNPQLPPALSRWNEPPSHRLIPWPYPWKIALKSQKS